MQYLYIFIFSTCRFLVQKTGSDYFALFSLLVDDEPYYMNGLFYVGESCVVIDIELAEGQTVKVQNRATSTVDNINSWFGGYLYQ